MPSDKPYVNTLNCSGFLNTASRDARYLDLVKLRHVIDRRSDEPVINLSTEDVELPAGIESAGGLHDYVPPNFEVPHLNVDPPLVPQRYHIEIWNEKSTMNDILLPLCERYGINYVHGVGEMSLTRCVELVDRARASGRPVRIIYISDFDPGGVSMPVAVARKVEWVVRKEGYDLDIQVRPIVLTPEQCIEYHLPPTPIKEGEKRAAAFMERFGVEGATELDALEALHPGELERILVEEIERYYDDTLDERIDDVVGEVQAELDDVNAEVKQQHAKAIKTLEIERKKVLTAISVFEKKAKPVLRKIEQDLEANAPDINNFDWPEAAEGDEDDDPMFDSTRDYVEQIDRYKEHQGKAVERKTTEMVCTNCGETFNAYREDMKFCSNKCRNASFYKQQQKAVGGKGSEKVCIECGNTFTARRKNMKFCSVKCKDAFNGRRKTARK